MVQKSDSYLDFSCLCRKLKKCQGFRPAVALHKSSNTYISQPLTQIAWVMLEQTLRPFFKKCMLTKLKLIRLKCSWVNKLKNVNFKKIFKDYVVASFVIISWLIKFVYNPFFSAFRKTNRYFKHQLKQNLDELFKHLLKSYNLIFTLLKQKRISQLARNQRINPNRNILPIIFLSDNLCSHWHVYFWRLSETTTQEGIF